MTKDRSFAWIWHFFWKDSVADGFETNIDPGYSGEWIWFKSAHNLVIDTMWYSCYAAEFTFVLLGMKVNYECFNIFTNRSLPARQSINHSMTHRNIQRWSKLSSLFSQNLFLKALVSPSTLNWAHTWRWLELPLQCAEFGDGARGREAVLSALPPSIPTAAMEFENMKWIMLARSRPPSLCGIVFAAAADERRRRFCACIAIRSGQISPL